MIRLLIFLAALALAALGLTWLANNPGVVDVTWRGEQYEVSLMFGLAAVMALAIAIDRVGSAALRLPHPFAGFGRRADPQAGEGVPGAVARPARRRRGRRA